MTSPNIDTRYAVQVGDDNVVLAATLTDGAGNPVDLAAISATVTFDAVPIVGAGTAISRSVTLVDAANGSVSVTLQTADLASGQEGVYLVTWTVTSGSTSESWPLPRFDQLDIVAVGRFGTFTYTRGSVAARDEVRLLIPDTAVYDDTLVLFSDEELDSFLSLTGSVPQLAAALAIETAGRDAALVERVKKTRDIDTDGAALLSSLRLAARELRDEYYRQRDIDNELASQAGGINVFQPNTGGVFVQRAIRQRTRWSSD